MLKSDLVGKLIEYKSFAGDTYYWWILDVVQEDGCTYYKIIDYSSEPGIHRFKVISASAKIIHMHCTIKDGPDE